MPLQIRRADRRLFSAPQTWAQMRGKRSRTARCRFRCIAHRQHRRFAVNEHSFVGNYVSSVAFLAVCILPGSGLNGTGDAKSGTLAEIARDELCGLSPSNNADKVCLLLSRSTVSTLGLETAIYCQSEGDDGNAAGGLLQFRVCGKSSAKNNLVKIQAGH